MFKHKLWIFHKCRSCKRSRISSFELNFLIHTCYYVCVCVSHSHPCFFSIWCAAVLHVSVHFVCFKLYFLWGSSECVIIFFSSFLCGLAIVFLTCFELVDIWFLELFLGKNIGALNPCCLGSFLQPSRILFCFLWSAFHLIWWK